MIRRGKTSTNTGSNVLHSWSDQRLHARNHSALFDTPAGIYDQTRILKSHCITLKKFHTINIYKCDEFVPHSLNGVIKLKAWRKGTGTGQGQGTNYWLILKRVSN